MAAAFGGVMDDVAGWFERRGEIPLVAPPGAREDVPLADDPDRPGDEFASDPIRGVAFVLESYDARGWPSMRTVRCLGIDLRTPVTLRAHCRLRDEPRVFRVDHIISIADYRTGAILSAEAQAALLAPYLPEPPADPDIALLWLLQRATRDGVYALLHVGMTDGRLSDASRRLVLDYVRSEAAQAGCALPSDKLIKLWVDNLSPPLSAVTVSVGRLLAERQRFARVLPWLLKIARSQQDFADQDESLFELIAEIRQHYRQTLRGRPSSTRAIS